MLLGAVALLGLIGLLGHRGGPGSSPSGLGDGLSLPLKARKRAWRPKAHGASSSPDDRPGSRRVSNLPDRPCCEALRPGVAGLPGPGPAAASGHVAILPGGIAEPPCGPPPAGAILSGPSAPETFGEPPKTRSGSSGPSRTGASNGSIRDARDPWRIPSVADATHRPIITTQDPIEEWMPSKSGERRPCHPLGLRHFRSDPP